MTDRVPGVDLDRVLPWFRDNVAEAEALSVQLIGHGRSNLTYRLQHEEENWVLRRPPLSHVQPTAHDMSREFRVISALADTDIMEYVEGMVPADSAQVGHNFDEGQRRRIGEELVDVLVRLHSLTPEDVGLGDFGRPKGYLERQVRRFTEQFERVKTRDLPELEDLARRLSAALPAESAPGIVHGDYRLDNTILDDEGHIRAVLDWEMATVGDSLADMGLLMMYWADEQTASVPALAIAGTAVTALPGFPTKEEVVAMYRERSGSDLSNLDFYTVLAHFKLSVILENMHRRFLAGGTVGAGFELIGDQVLLLTRRGLAVADASSIAALRG
jgi:aminoglycoside phosphotransferase (APT) family kinase protein